MAKPWQSHEEFLVDRALESAISDPKLIRELRPLYPVALFQDTRGLTKSSPGINDILDTDRQMVTNRGMLSGFPVRRTMIDDSWSGAGRYSMEALG